MGQQMKILKTILRYAGAVVFAIIAWECANWFLYNYGDSIGSRHHILVIWGTAGLTALGLQKLFFRACPYFNILGVLVLLAYALEALLLFGAGIYYGPGGILLILLLLAGISAYIVKNRAKKKGYPELFAWWLYGFFLPPVALFHTSRMKPAIDKSFSLTKTQCRLLFAMALVSLVACLLLISERFAYLQFNWSIWRSLDFAAAFFPYCFAFIYRKNSQSLLGFAMLGLAIKILNCFGFSFTEWHSFATEAGIWLSIAAIHLKPRKILASLCVLYVAAQAAIILSSNLGLYKTFIDVSDYICYTIILSIFIGFFSRNIEPLTGQKCNE
jgi:hypothetical protein